MDDTTSSEQSRAAVDPGDQPLNPDEEIVELEKLLAAEPDDFQARCRLGELYFSKGRLDDALVEVKKSIEMAEGIRSEMNRSLAMYYSNLTLMVVLGVMLLTMDRSRRDASDSVADQAVMRTSDSLVGGHV